MFQYLNDEMFKSLQKNKSKVCDSLINKIHLDVDIYYNSINIFVGRQGSGNTFNCLKEIIKITTLNAAHLLVYITKSGNKSDDNMPSQSYIILFKCTILEKSINNN